ncbi:RagB/SusD family nutrient uptake outer membrane protein [Chitinophaga cymbidii]|uniref:Starch-binding protein n=1 Tax=Chitinophaga cymbidii TaxID=1096750 RepID=A0A512RJI9_9BACT|nr:RagB/SusD family nutrient uptake outer membrane protein [Chitinophaga cymbidii]GEP95866.1 hypothetical protein CCY01nite_21260 [Chitinophaga cymbidii]
MKKFIPIFLISIILLQSCSLNFDPITEVSDASFWKTPADFKLAANNFYFSLEEHPGMSVGDNRSDIAYGITPNTTSNGTALTPESLGFWNNSYTTIRGCNNLIAKAESSPIKEQVAQWVGEARFFRAYTYFRLMKDLGDVPLIDKLLDLNSPELYGARTPRAEVVDFILADLDYAASVLPLQKQLKAEDDGRVTKGAALALKARVALFEGTWGKFRGDARANERLDDAIEAAAEVINSKQYALFSGKGAQSYRYQFIDEGDRSTECVLDRRFDVNVDPQSWANLIYYGEMSPTKKMADMYLCRDGLPISQSSSFQGYATFTSEYENRDPRMTQTILLPGSKVAQPFYPDQATAPERWPLFNSRPFAYTGYMLYKFLSEDPVGNATSGKHNFDWHIIRYAEVLLIFAEATFERNNAISDDDLNKSVNVVRSRTGVDMPPLTNTFVQVNGLDMRTEIRRERTVELAFEGYRFDDLRRWKTAETEMPLALKGFKYTGTEWQTRPPYSTTNFTVDNEGFIIVEAAAKRHFDPAKHYLFPLPANQVTINPKLKQNPYW